MKIRPLAVKVGLLALSTMLALGCVELFVRLAALDRPIVWQPNPELGWWHVAGARRHWTEEGDGTIEINPLGMRDAARSLDKPQAVFRIGVFGDSIREAVPGRSRPNLLSTPRAPTPTQRLQR